MTPSLKEEVSDGGTSLQGMESTAEETQDSLTGYSAPAMANNNGAYDTGLDTTIATNNFQEVDQNHQKGFESTGESIEHDAPINPVFILAPETRENRATLYELEHKYDNRRLYGKVSTCAVKVNRVTSQVEKRALEKQFAVDKVLEDLCLIEQLSSRLVQATDMKNIFEVFFIKPTYAWSERTSRIAQGLCKNFESQRWGDSSIAAAATQSASLTGVEINDSEGEDKKEEDRDDGIVTDTSQKQNTQRSTSRQRRPINAASSISSSASAIQPLSGKKTLLFPEPDHPVYGNGKVMHGIALLRNEDTTRKSYVLDRRYKQRPANRVGHNGHQVGNCWPFQICLLRDGVHGALQGGIYGNVTTGAYSIIVLGSVYSEMDSDTGDTLYYTGSGSLENTDPKNPKATEGTKALQTSQAMNQAVRVIRGKSDKYAGAPDVGFRYDGLYDVVSSEEKYNNKGGVYLVFKLERQGGQPRIAESKPDPALQKKFRAIKQQF